jgi:hypothetical protein
MLIRKARRKKERQENPVFGCCLEIAATVDQHVSFAVTNGKRVVFALAG